MPAQFPASTDPFAATVAMAETVQMHDAPEPVLDYGERKKSGPAALVVAILVHALVLWMLLNKTLIIEQTRVRGGELIAWMAPQPANKPKPQPSPAKPPQPKTAKPRVQPQLDVPRQVLVQSNETAITAQDIEQPKEAPKAQEEPPMDMMAQIEANRRRRAEAAGAPTAGPESEGERASRIAKANIAAAVGRGQDKDDTGGVFQIRNQTFRSADIAFKGWNTNFKRNWSQLVRVEAADESDIEMAGVRKMIEIIRQHKQEDFIWESHRLARNVTLSARPRDNEELERFLLREFYPDYKPSFRSGRG